MRSFIAVFVLLSSFFASAAALDEFFSDKVVFDPNVPTPESVLGYPVGQWHVRHDQLVQYMRALADSSERMKLEVIGYTHEHRPLVQLIVTRPNRLKNIEEVRAKHLARLSGNTDAADPGPLVVMMGYSVHGNEASGANAALLFAYYLAAARGEQIEKYLDDMVILLDPSFNPDGLDRFAGWVNSNKGLTANSDDNNRLENEPWPGGRTNHYWFDLNRDWLMLVHPESKARITRFHQWKPNVVSDYHEMGSNSTFFFQPGIASRKNPWTPERNVELTKAIGTYHAESFDKQNVLYFTEEDYDDFYAGKGSTYPDLNGSVGILFEQASARGFVRDTVNGKLTFVDAIKNQLSASLSTLKGADAQRQPLLSYQQQFYMDYRKLADKDPVDGYLISEAFDNDRFNALLRLLKAHQIAAYPLMKDFKVNNREFDSRHSYFVPLAQPQYRLIKSLFSRRKSFEDNTFYDVSNWNLAWAYNIDFEPVSSDWGLKLADTPWQEPAPLRMSGLKPAYAFAFSWDEQKAAVMLQRLLDKGIEVKVATKGFSVNTGSGTKQFEPGSIVVPAAIQRYKDWLDVLQRARAETQVDVQAIGSGLTDSGIDLGSRSLMPVAAPKVLLLGGRGVNSYEVGEIWHFLDTYLGLPVSIVELDRLPRVDLSSYSHVILVDGDYRKIDEQGVARLKRWLRKGGVLWGQKKAASWLIDQEILKANYTSANEMAKRMESSALKYGEQDSVEARQSIAGAAFAVELDLSHPLAFGFHNARLPVFKNSTLVLHRSSKPFITVGSYDKYPLLGGYAAEENVEKIAQSSFMVAHSYGQGVVIGVADDVDFRGYWQGTRRLLTNSLYFGPIVQASGE